MNAALISVSVLSADFGKLAEELSLLKEAGADLIHLDMMDGHYVPNLSFGIPVIRRIRQLTDLPLDAHLMVTNPSQYLDPLADIGVDWISFHQETEFHSHRLIQKIKAKGIKAGIALNPGTPVNSLDSIYTDLDFILLMSVNPGFSGQSFIPSVYSKLRTLRQDYRFGAYLEVDGGVCDTNAQLLYEAGADMLVSASYIFSSPDYGIAIDNLKYKCLKG